MPSAVPSSGPPGPGQVEPSADRSRRQAWTDRADLAQFWEGFYVRTGWDPGEGRLGLLLLGVVVVLGAATTVLPARLLLVAGLGFAVVVAAVRSPLAAFVAVLGVNLLPVSVFAGALPAAIDVRVVAVPFIAALFYHSAVAPRAGLTARRQAGCLLALLATGIASIAWSIDRFKTVQSCFTLVLAIVLLELSTTRLSAPRRRQCLRGFAMVVLPLSLIALAVPAVGFLGGRGRGILINPNGLALFVLLVLPLLLTRPGWPFAVGLLGMAEVGITASRAGALAVLVELLVLVLRSSGRRRNRLVVVGLSVLIAGVAFVAITGKTDTGGAKLARSNDSRSQQWGDGIKLFQQSPLVGLGFGASPTDVASSYIKVLVELGLLGVVVAGATVGAAGSMIRRGDSVVAATVAGALIDGVFEAWMFVGGSLFFIMFWLVVLSDGAEPPPVRRQRRVMRRAPATARSGPVRPAARP